MSDAGTADGRVMAATGGTVAGGRFMIAKEKEDGGR